MACCSMGDVTAVVPVCAELGMGVAHGFPVFVGGSAMILPCVTLASFTFQDRRVRVQDEENRQLHSTAMWPSCRVEKVT